MSYVRLGFNPQFYAAVHTPDGVIMNSYHVRHANDDCKQ